MYRKARQAAEAEFKRYGADRWTWGTGRGKHETVTVEFGAMTVSMGFSHSAVCETYTKQIIRNRFRQEGIKAP
jgi:hypothetical protein